MTDNNINNGSPGSPDETGDEVDIGQFCDCVAGGSCRVEGRSSATIHRVRLWWLDPNDPRDPDTVASPAQLDAWITAGVIVGAFCPTCDDVVINCPSFDGFLTAERWDTDDDV
jgi:hypothetical protein